MLKVFSVLLNLFLIFLIFLQLPPESMGLASFTIKRNLLGSPASTQRFLKLITMIGIFLYFWLALQLNLVAP